MMNGNDNDDGNSNGRQRW